MTDDQLTGALIVGFPVGPRVETGQLVRLVAAGEVRVEFRAGRGGFLRGDALTLAPAEIIGQNQS